MKNLIGRKEIIPYLNERLKINHELYRNKCKFLKERANNRIEYYKSIDNYKNFKELMTESDFKELKRNQKNRYYKRYRANKKLKPLIELDENRLVFITMTFSDNQLKTKEETRTKKINKWLKDHCSYSIANIDYGKTTEREHHHAVGYLFKDEVLKPIIKEDGTQAKSKKGFLIYELERQNYNEFLKSTKNDKSFEPTICKVDRNDEDIKMKKLSNYLVKRLNDHSNKVTTKNRRLRVLY